MTLAITGATGQLGRLVINTLKTKTAPGGIVALARALDKAADLGVPARLFDYDAPETLAAALEGIDTLLLISGSDIGRRVAQHGAVIAAAKAARGSPYRIYQPSEGAPQHAWPCRRACRDGKAVGRVGHRPYRAAQWLVYRKLRHGPARGAGTQRPGRGCQGWVDLGGGALRLCRGCRRRSAGFGSSGQNR